MSKKNMAIKSDVQVMEARLRKVCKGKTTSEFWKPLAEFVLKETQAAYEEGHDMGVETGQDSHWE